MSYIHYYAYSDKLTQGFTVC